MIRRFTRVNYFEGQLLSASDLQDEQDYFRAKMQLQNRSHFGAGIVTGLEVVAGENGLLVTPGVAYDCLGRELIVEESTEVEGAPECDGPYVLLEYKEYPACPGPAPESTPTRIIEGVRAYLGDSSLPSTHRRTDRCWQACNRCKAVPIAIVRGRKGVKAFF